MSDSTSFAEIFARQEREAEAFFELHRKALLESGAGRLHNILCSSYPVAEAAIAEAQKLATSALANGLPRDVLEQFLDLCLRHRGQIAPLLTDREMQPVNRGDIAF